jgi:hypothetical protein
MKSSRLTVRSNPRPIHRVHTGLRGVNLIKDHKVRPASDKVSLVREIYQQITAQQLLSLLGGWGSGNWLHTPKDALQSDAYGR